MLAHRLQRRPSIRPVLAERFLWLAMSPLPSPHPHTPPPPSRCHTARIVYVTVATSALIGGGGDFYYHISYLVIHSSVDTVLNISLKVSQILHYHSQLTSVFSIYIINKLCLIIYRLYLYVLSLWYMFYDS